MIWYTLIFILLLFSIRLGNGILSKKNNFGRYILFFVIPTFICFGYMTGSDWRMYEREFYDISLRLDSKEPTYYILTQLFRSLGWGFWEFSIFYKLIGYFVFLKIYLRYSLNNIWGLIYWFPNFGLFMWIDHPARNFIACIILFIGLIYIEQKKIFKFVLLVLIASTFHATSLALLPIYFVVNYLPGKRYNYWLVSIFIFFFISELLRVYLLPFMDIINMANRIEGYIAVGEYGEKMSIIRFLIIVIFLFLGNYNIDYIRNKTKYADIVLKLSYVYAAFFCIGNIHHLFFRFQLFLCIPFCVLIAYLCRYICNITVRVGFLSFIILFSYVYMYDLISRDSRYVPYSNYLEYIFTDKPSYNYRFDYNEIHSPYRNKN